MTFALQGIRFDAFLDPDSFYYGGIIATDENGLSCTFYIEDYCYVVTPVTAIRAAGAFLAEVNGQ